MRISKKLALWYAGGNKKGRTTLMKSRGRDAVGTGKDPLTGAEEGKSRQRSQGNSVSREVSKK